MPVRDVTKPSAHARRASAVHLSLDEILRITGCTNTAVRPAQQDRRGSVRVRRAKAVVLLPMRDRGKRPRRGCLRDLSEQGIGLLYSDRIEPGEQFLVVLPRPGLSELRVCCRAVRCQQLIKDLYAIGAELECISEGRRAVRMHEQAS